jgi:type I restriction enzyme M protein
MAKANKKNEDQQPLEKTLWLTADKLRKNLDASEYKHIVLGLIFLKYISDAFDDLHQKLITGEGEYAGSNPEDPDEYRAENVFFVPQEARWSHLLSRAKLPTVGVDIDNAMDAIEKENPQLRGVLTKDFAKPKLDKQSLGELLDMVGTIDLGSAVAQSKDLLGRVFEYFLGQFALAEGKKGGQFYTPRSVVQLLVEMLEPYKGRVFDPCCGSGGMFVHSEKFVLAHQGKIDDISIYGQESNQTTWRLCAMNLAIRGIDSSNVKWNNEGSFLRDAHPDLKADFIIANPPFNVSDWSGELLQTDGRWQYGIPPPGNANFAWLQHMLYHLSPKGRAGVVLSKGSLTSKQSNEGVIRKNLVDAGIVDCVISLPTKLFLNTQIPACLWFLNRETPRPRKGNVLFIDARNLGFLINRRTRDLSDADLKNVADTYHNWVKGNGAYQDIAGFCKTVPISDIKALDYVLTPGRYIGLPDDDEDFDFKERMKKLKSELVVQMDEETLLNKKIMDILETLEYDR